jgi:probable FeS assembly SUF system protein SufT
MFNYRKPMSPSERTLTRDVSSTLVPAGDTVNLPAGTRVTITHRLGGNFTVVCDYGMFRINGADAEALGEEKPGTAAVAQNGNDGKNGSDGTAVASGPPAEPLLWEALKTVFDPEIPVNIVDLGLIYSLEIKDLGESRHGVEVKMTLTAPGCGMGPAIAEDARSRLVSVPGVSEANVEITWDPPWSQERISEDGKMQLGLI